ncbi:sortase-associated OmpA-like protein PdsO [Thalassotalea euphylliae]|uniref:sortase-associated OmpA-like protein PdsO n=1 Tax=Thalassotalea euphylliae TaxID=1655234 RepID=UPI00362BC5A5
MKNALITSAVITSLVLSPATLAKDDGLTDAQKEEIGFGTGAVVGAIFGGPAGALITGLASTFLVKTVNQDDEINTLVAQHSQQAKDFDMQLAKLNHQMMLAEQQHQQELIALEQQNGKHSALAAANLLLSMQFKTGSSEVPTYYEEQIASLASILNQHDELSIDLSGHADLLGNSTLNKKLSLARAEAVKSKLVNYGVDADKISTQGFGDSQPVVANAQQKSSFYDRRVVLKVNNNTQTAKN